MILGLNVYSGNDSYLSLTSNDIKISRLECTDCILDYLDLENVSNEYKEFERKEWGDDTVLLCDYKNTYNAGNIDYVYHKQNIARIKKRKVTEDFTPYSIGWEVVKDIPYDDFVKVQTKRKYTYIDKFIESKEWYEYAIFSVINGVESNVYNSDYVYADFDGIKISDKNESYYSYLEIEFTDNQCGEDFTVPTFSRKYPYYFKVGNQNYASGTAKLMIYVMDDNCEFDEKNSIKMRKKFKEWLKNGKPKFLQLYDGRSYIVCVTGDITDNVESHPMLVTTSFSWTEIADKDSYEDYIACGLR